MSTDRRIPVDRSLSSYSVERSYWRKDRIAEHGVDPDGDEPGEFICPEDDCGAPITRGASGTEYGHRRAQGRGRKRCPRRPSRVDPSHKDPRGEQ